MQEVFINMNAQGTDKYKNIDSMGSITNSKHHKLHQGTQEEKQEEPTLSKLI